MGKQRRHHFILIALPCILLAIITLLLSGSRQILQQPEVTSNQMTQARKQADGVEKEFMIPGHVEPSPSTIPYSASNTPTNALQVSAATYLGAMDNNQTTGVDIGLDGTIFVSGMLTGTVPVTHEPTVLLHGERGVIMRLDRSGTRLLSVTRIGSSVNQVSINARGQIVACGDFGVVLLNNTASRIYWHRQPGPGYRCTSAADGAVAVLVGQTGGEKAVSKGKIFLYAANGVELASWHGDGWQNDIAIDGAHQLVVTTGYTYLPNVGEMVSLQAWSYEGKKSWQNYNFKANELARYQVQAGTRGERVSIGRDGMLYFAGTTRGGGTIFGRDPTNIAIAAGDREVSPDQYNSYTGSTSNQITWYGRYNPTNGTLLQGQFVVTRLDTGDTNIIRPGAIMADEYGRVYLAGVACYAIANRGGQSIAGIPVAIYTGCEAFLYIAASDLQQRLVWTVFTAPGTHASMAQAVNVRNGVAALGVTLGKGALITANALQTVPGNMYVAVWPQKAE